MMGPVRVHPQTVQISVRFGSVWLNFTPAGATMEHAQHIDFGPFRLELTKKRLWRGEQERELRPMAVAVLRYLAERPGQLVGKEELLKQVWAGTIVTKTALKVCVREIRQALDDEVSAPRYIETVGRLGYRFIAPLTTAAPPVQSLRFKVQGSESAPAPSPQSSALIVGRKTELDQLHSWLEQALRGTRWVVFITGEPGVGKTTVVDLFLERIRAGGEVRIGRGQCVEQYGQGEAYLPVLEALGQVCHAPGGQQVIEVLSRYAPPGCCRCRRWWRGASWPPYNSGR